MTKETRKTILLVEDDMITSRTLAAVLRRYGFNVITSMTGEDSVEVVRANREIDLVLMDIFLGNGIDGIEAAGLILRERDIPLVFLSSHAGREIVSETEKVASYGYVVKQSGDSVLAAIINTAFRLHDARMGMIDIDQVEDALRKSEQNYREIFNSTNEAIFIDEAATGRMIDVNDSMLRMYGYSSREEVLAGNIGDLSADEAPYDQNGAMEHVMKAIKEGPQTFEWRAKKKNGETFWAEVSLRSSRIGGEGRVLAVVRDISGRKQGEEILRQKTVALSEALEAKNALLNELQHRVKNTLSMIAGLIEIEAMNYASPDTVVVLNKLAARINTISNLYTLLYGTGDVQRVRLDHYFSGIIDSLSATFIDGTRDVKIIRDFENIEVDSRRAAPFGLVLNELFTNALKYAFSYGGSGDVHVKLWRGGDNINLSVSDNGAGLPPDFNMDKSHGMGMMLVQLLAKQLGGSLSFEGTAGTVFTVTVPQA